jgi:hypothetical protein
MLQKNIEELKKEHVLLIVKTDVIRIMRVKSIFKKLKQSG